MRICLISFEFLPKTGFGGAAALYSDLAAALSKLGHDVTVLSGNTGRQVEVANYQGAKNVRFGARRLRPRALACIERAAAVLREYRRIVSKDGQFDVVESPELLGEPLLIHALAERAPYLTRLITPHYLLHKMNGMRSLITVDWIERKNAEGSDLVLADSENWGRAILKDWRIEGSRLRLCPVGIDLERIDKVEERTSPIAKPYVLFAGRLTMSKGPQILATAAPAILKECPDAKIVFAGGDTMTDSGLTVKETILKAAPPDTRGALVFLGFVESWEELVNLYRGAAVCIKADNYGNHSFDAMGQMACGRPLICTKTEGNLDMIEHGANGFLFDRDEPGQLSQIATRLINDVNLQKSVGLRARETIERRFTSDRCAEMSIPKYEEASEIAPWKRAT